MYKLLSISLLTIFLFSHSLWLIRLFLKTATAAGTIVKSDGKELLIKPSSPEGDGAVSAIQDLNWLSLCTWNQRRAENSGQR